MNQILRQEQRRYLNGVGKIGRTHQILDQLQQKMAGYHQRKRTEQQLLNSQDQPPQPTKTKNSFKLFTKPHNPNNQTKMRVQQLQLQKEGTYGGESNDGGEGRVGHLLQEVEAIERLVRKKLSLKEERVAQLQREIQLQKQQKVHLYKINVQLQSELADLVSGKEELQKKFTAEEEELERQFKFLKGKYDQNKMQNKRLKKEEELMMKTLKQSQQNQKNFHQSQIKVIRNQSRGKLPSKKEQNIQEQSYLRGLVTELDKLRRMVKQKMKKSTSKSRIR